MYVCARRLLPTHSANRSRHRGTRDEVLEHSYQDRSSTVSHPDYAWCRSWCLQVAELLLIMYIYLVILIALLFYYHFILYYHSRCVKHVAPP